ncbi:MAG: phage terminase large subunit family protein [Planctomycetota bacterium]|jgi:phage terminase large subunit GpA-like protein|nr:phage terminase large subunit family protein [Planctomycetota bacterium]
MEDTDGVAIIEFAKLRTQTYGDRASIAIFGHPRSTHGKMWRRWQDALTRFMWQVPCPHCAGHQALTWNQVRWPEGLTDDIGHKATTR